MSVPALLRRVPPLRNRPPAPADPFTDDVRASAAQGTQLGDDVTAVDDVLVPAFHRADGEAVLAQQRWARRELGLLILSGLLVVASSVQAAYGESGWPGLVVAALGGIAAVLAGTTRSSDARGVYLRARREAERLRSLAWTHLAATEAGDPRHRRRLLMRSVARIRLQSVEGSGDIPQQTESDEEAAVGVPASDAPREGNATAEPRAEHLVGLYVDGRLGDQRAWYRRRQAEFDAAERQGGRIRTALLVVATILGAFSASDVLPESALPWLGVAATVATALSAITTGWMRLQAFDTRARLYELTEARLGAAQADRPLTVDGVRAEAYLGQCENIMLAEHGAWTSQTPVSAREPTTDERTGA